jgi:phospho-N-acetylmuramoyl-pentapeptide-transferase
VTAKSVSDLLFGDLRMFTFALIAAGIGAYPIFRLLLALKSRQTVSQYAPEGHQKKQGTPTMGGLIVVFGFLVSCFLQMNQGLPGPFAPPHAIGISMTSFDFAIPILFCGFAVIGFTDDFVVPRLMVGKRGLGWKQKILMQLVVASVCAFMMCPDHLVSAVVTVFLILFYSNAYNFSDGLDALAALLLIGFGVGLIVISPVLSGAILALLGAILPFLFYNRPRARVFMGDVGSLPIGAVLGAAVACALLPQTWPLARASYASAPVDFLNGQGFFAPWWDCLALLVASGMMIVELVPVPLQILSVKLRKKKLFSFTPIHHAFERKGWPERKVVGYFAACQVLLSAVAIGIHYYGLSTMPRITR